MCRVLSFTLQSQPTLTISDSRPENYYMYLPHPHKEADAGGGDVPHDEMLIFKSCRKTVLWHQECMFEEDQNEKLDEAEVIIMHYFVAISPTLSSPS